MKKDYRPLRDPFVRETAPSEYDELPLERLKERYRTQQRRIDTRNGQLQAKLAQSPFATHQELLAVRRDIDALECVLTAISRAIARKVVEG